MKAVSFALVLLLCLFPIDTYSSETPVCVPPPARRAYVTLITTSDNYAYGAAVLGVSLKTNRVEANLVAMVTQKVNHKTKTLLTSSGWELQEVEIIENHPDYDRNRKRDFTDIMTKVP